MQEVTAIFVGPQGSGKGTQVKLLKEYLAAHDKERNIFLFEAGAHLRKFSEGEGYTQELVRTSLARGELQPDFITVSVSANAFIECMQGNVHLLIDGFPRSDIQALALDSIVRFYSRENPIIINLTASEPVIMERLLKRGRNDDTEAGIKERLRWHHETVKPVIERYRNNPNYRFLELSGEGDSEAIHREIITTLGIEIQ